MTKDNIKEIEDFDASLEQYEEMSNKLSQLQAENKLLKDKYACHLADCESSEIKGKIINSDKSSDVCFEYKECSCGLDKILNNKG